MKYTSFSTETSRITAAPLSPRIGSGDFSLERTGVQIYTTMNTRLFVLEDYIGTGRISDSDDALIRECSAIIAAGGIAAFPTETVYGLGGSAFSPDAACRIYCAKGRPSDNPLIVHISKIGDLGILARDIPEKAFALADRCWPGPLTMILPKADAVPGEVTGGLSTVAVRMPSHPAAQRLITYAGVPLAAPSANISGRPSTTSGRHCMDDLYGRVDAILDAGSSDIGLESTIIDLCSATPVLLRPGAVTAEMLREVLGQELSFDRALSGPLGADERPRAPGMKYRHYAPQAPMVLISPDAQESEKETAERILSLIGENKNKYSHIALICSEECIEELRKSGGLSDIGESHVLGSREDEKAIAHRLFDCLRQLDENGADFIIAEGIRERGLGLAIMNRLKKASSWQLITV